MNLFTQDPSDLKREKRICNRLAIAVIALYLLLSFIGCNVHKAMKVELIKADLDPAKIVEDKPPYGSLVALFFVMLAIALLVKYRKNIITFLKGFVTGI